MKEQYDIIIGLEIHVQTKTSTKMFCSCAAQYFEKEPNTQTCAVCAGLPGALPVPNKRAIEKCILLGLATNSEISKNIRFDRKHYFYPDLPKGYQISQYENPICFDGFVHVKNLNGEKVKIEIERIHQEEDVAKSLHVKDYTLIDCNKSGIPLIEIVTKPVIKSAFEAKGYASKIRQIVRYLGISNADMEKGQMRCEPNISVQKKGSWEYKNGMICSNEGCELNPKVEVKNIGSISAVEKSIEYEVERQIKEIENGEKIIQQTRGWNARKGITEFQRSKESAQDYRYCPDPDIPVIKITQDVIEKIKGELVELADEKIEKYTEDYKLSEYDAQVITASKESSMFFETLLEKVAEELDKQKAAKAVTNWIIGPIYAHLNSTGKSFKDLESIIDDLGELILKVEKNELLNRKAKEILEKALDEGISLKKLIEESDVEVITNEGEIEEFAKKAIAENPNAVLDYKGGKTNAVGFLTGQVMKMSKGNADPKVVHEVLVKLIEKTK
jgi:aspartyl-tRNA(Asn)/glutamyl-tRNA(Gln) amidotransferase subunit B